MSVTVTHEQDHYAIAVDGRTVGRADYVDQGDRRIFTHTEIDPAVGGQGHGRTLVRHALDDTRAADKQIVPACSFVARVLQEE